VDLAGELVAVADLEALLVLKLDADIAIAGGGDDELDVVVLVRADDDAALFAGLVDLRDRAVDACADDPRAAGGAEARGQRVDERIRFPPRGTLAVETEDANADLQVEVPRAELVACAVWLSPGETGAGAIAIEQAALWAVEVELVRQRDAGVKVAGEQLALLQRFDEGTT
jgi:hypothetical protein